MVALSIVLSLPMSWEEIAIKASLRSDIPLSKDSRHVSRESLTTADEEGSLFSFVATAVASSKLLWRACIPILRTEMGSVLPVR